MRQYAVNQLSFSVPDQLTDKSVLIFTEEVHPGQRTSQSNIIISHDKILKTDTLEQYLERQKKELKERMPVFEVLAEKALIICGIPAIQGDYQWIVGGVAIYQRQVAFIIKAEDPLQTSKITMFAATSAKDQKQKIFDTLANVLQTVLINTQIDKKA